MWRQTCQNREWKDGRTISFDKGAALGSCRRGSAWRTLSSPSSWSRKANKEIGSQLHIAESTVKLHVNTLFEKLGVKSRTEAMRAGLERGLIRLR
jgi:Bacterial regulatory proteins, luxR family